MKLDILWPDLNLKIFSDDKLLEEDGDEEYDLGEGDEEALLGGYAEEVNSVFLYRFSLYTFLFDQIWCHFLTGMLFGGFNFV